MKLVKCRKCGTAVMTDDSMIETMISEMNECNKQASYSKGEKRNLYLQKASQLKKMITQVQHRLSGIDARKNGLYLKRLQNHLIDNGLMSWEGMDLIRDQAEAEAKKKDEADSLEIEKVYGAYRNSMVNRTNKDLTAREALKTIK